MLNFTKKFYVFSKTKKGNNIENEINSVTNKEILEKMPI